MTREQIIDMKKQREIEEQHKESLEQTDCTRDYVQIMMCVPDDTMNPKYDPEYILNENEDMNFIAGQMDGVNY